MNKHLSFKLAAFACAMAAIFTPAAAKASTFTFHLDLNVSSLIGAPNSPFYLDFQLNKGSTTANNTVTLQGFTFSGAGAGPSGAATVVGGSLITGDMGSTITLTESSSSPFNELYQAFTTTTSDIQFDVTTTQNFLGAQPDGFVVSILDSTLSNIVTTDLSGSSMATLPIDGGNTLSDVATFTSTSPSGATAVASVPEPSAAAALVGGAGCLLALRRRRVRLAA
jgi:hypothetical protein